MPNVPGGSITEIARLSPVFRPLTALALQPRGLLNLPLAPPPAFPLQFNENIPLRNQPTVTNTVPGAMAIQKALDRFQWVQQAGNPVSYARHIRRQPLHGNSPKPVLFQFAKGDLTVPNPTTTAILRAGNLADRATYFRNDLAFAANPAVSKNPHTFLTNISGAGAGYAIGAQTQMATFFASGGVTVIDPTARQARSSRYRSCCRCLKDSTTCRETLAVLGLNPGRAWLAPSVDVRRDQRCADQARATRAAMPMMTTETSNLRKRTRVNSRAWSN